MELTWRSFWFGTKGWIEELIGIPETLFHVHVGLGLFLGFALLLRRRRNGLLLAWLCVLVLQALNEALDARDWYNWTGTVNWREALSDTAATLFWPSVLLVLGPRITRTSTDRR